MTAAHRDCTCPHCTVRRIELVRTLRERLEGRGGPYTERLREALARQEERLQVQREGA